MKQFSCRIAAMLVCVCMLLGVVACSNDPDDNTDTTASTTTSTEAADTTTTKSGGTTMTFHKGPNQTVTTTQPKEPEKYGVATDENTLFPFFTRDGAAMASGLKTVKFIDESAPLTVIPNSAIVARNEVTKPDAKWRFTHESAIAVHKGVIYCCWFSNYEHEIQGFTPIRGCYSTDGGKTWSKPEIWMQDNSGTQLSPPIFGEAEGKLYLSIGLMNGNDNMLGMDWYVLDPATKKFNICRKVRDGVKMHNNLMKLPNGKIITPIRVGKAGHSPQIPAVWISDSGKIDTLDWRVVKLEDDNKLPNGQANICPENALMRVGNTLYMFIRNEYNLVPLVYVSKDLGETWSDLMTCDIPFCPPTKIAAGTLSDGRGYIVANIDKTSRRKLVLYVTEKGSAQITKQMVLFDDAAPVFGGAHGAHYPSVWEDNGKLYISATINYNDTATTETDWEYRGAAAWVLDIAKI